MDLGKLLPAKEGVFLQLLHPVTKLPLYMQKDTVDENGATVIDDDGKTVSVDDLDRPIGLVVVGMDSEEYAARERWLLDQKLQKAEASSKSGKSTKTTAEEVHRESINAMIACIKGFRNIWYDGTELNFSQQNARMLLEKFRWMREFLDKELADRSNFIEG